MDLIIHQIADWSNYFWHLCNMNMWSHMTDLLACRVVFKGSWKIINSLAAAQTTADFPQFGFPIWINISLAHLKFLFTERCQIMQSLYLRQGWRDHPKGWGCTLKGRFRICEAGFRYKAGEPFCKKTGGAKSLLLRKPRRGTSQKTYSCSGNSSSKYWLGWVEYKCNPHFSDFICEKRKSKTKKKA